MKKILNMKVFIIMFVFLLLFGNYNVNASNIEEKDNNLEDNISISDLQSDDTIDNKEEKIIKYDATTGKSTVINIEELEKKNQLLKATSNTPCNCIEGYNPYAIQYLDRNNIIQPCYMPDSFFTKINDTSEFPYRVTCRMIINGGLDYGSGFLVAPNLMLTAAHTVYDEKNDNEINSFTVYPAYNDGIYNGCSSGWQAIYRSSIWLETHNREYDWALVELKEDLGNQLGWYGTVSYGSDSSLKNLSVRMLGYPKELDQAKHQYYTSGSINDVYSRYFITSSGNKGGMSGGPVIINDSNNSSNNYAVGIISANITHLPIDQTYGVRLNDYLIDLIRTYINK